MFTLRSSPSFVAKNIRFTAFAGAALTLLSSTASAADVTWNGGGANTNWNTAGNWGGTAPVSGDSLIFSGSVRPSTVNNFAAGTEFAGIRFAGGAVSFVLAGTGSGLNGITLTGGIVNASSNLQTITLPTILNTTQTFDTGSAGLTVGAIGGGASGVISGAGGLIKTGSGTLTLNATNTYTGATVIDEGTLLLGNSGVGALAASTAVTVSSGALFHMGDRSATVGSIAGDGNIAGTGNITLTTGGNNGSSVFSGNIAFTGGAGAGSLIKNGTGTLTLEGTNTYGVTTINGGTVVFRNTAAKGTGTATAQAAGSIGLGVGGTGYYNATQVAALFNTNTLAGFSLAAGSGVAIDTSAGDFTHGISLGGARALTKLGANTLTLSAANTYSGATTVSEGTLIVDGSVANSTTTVRSGATLGGSGTAGAIVLQNGGFLSPGSAAAGGAGTLNAASLDWSAGGVLRFNLGTTFDALLLSGSLTKSGSGTYLFDFLNSAPAAGAYALVDAGAITGFSLSDFSYTNLAGTGYFTFTGNALTFTVVPEGDFAYGLVPLAAWLAIRRRRRTR